MENNVHAGFDIAYTMDGLNRLTHAEEGTWGGSSISSRTRQQLWTLDQVGNWEVTQLDLNGDNDFVDTDEYDDDRTHNVVNELTARDVDDDSSDDYTLTYDPVGNLTDDGKDYTYVYDAFGRLRMVKKRGSGDLVVENRYNGLGYRIGTHYDVDADMTVENTSDDPWYYFVYTDRWQNVATFRDTDSDPKEQFIYHTAGAGGYGGSSALDAVAFRDKDANTAWASASDGTLEERICYEHNWRGDVVALVDDARNQVEDVRYSPYGIPNASPNGDTDSDGDTDATDVTQIDTWIAGATYEVRGDLDLDGDVDTADKTAASSRSGTTLGWQVLSADDVSNRKAYPGFVNDFAASLQFHVRHRVYDAELGRWTRRDPLGYVDGMSLVAYCHQSPIGYSDSTGLACVHGGVCPPTITDEGAEVPAMACPQCASAVLDDWLLLVFQTPTCKMCLHCLSGSMSDKGGFTFKDPNGTSCMYVYVGPPGDCGLYTTIVAHEMVHAMDNCSGCNDGKGKDPCLVALCTEVRAYFYTEPACRNGPPSQRLRCALTRANGSTKKLGCPPVLPGTEEAVQKLMECTQIWRTCRAVAPPGEPKHPGGFQ